MQSTKVFASSDTIYAFVDRANPEHIKAKAYFRYFAEKKYQVFTDYLSIGEAYTGIYIKISPSLAKDFLRGVFLSSINILYPNESDVKAALKTLVGYGNTELTFKEAQMAVLANRNSINLVCTFKYQHSLFGLQSFYLPI